MDKNKTGEKYILLLACWFVAGLTAGSASALGSDTVFGFMEKVSAKRYIISGTLTNLPFWCCAFIPSKNLHRVGAGCIGIAVKGFLIGCASAYIFLNGSGCLPIYAANIMPQLLSSIPLLFIGFTAVLSRKPSEYSYFGVLKDFLLSAAAALLSSCVQFVFFFVFTQFN